MVLLNVNFIKKEIDNTGNTCTITEISKSVGTDEYRIITETPTTNSNIKCWVQILSEEDVRESQGNARVGNFIFWFSSDRESLCVQGNRITFDSKDFEMTDVRKFDILGTTVLVECITKQV